MGKPPLAPLSNAEAVATIERVVRAVMEEDFKAVLIQEARRTHEGAINDMARAAMSRVLAEHGVLPPGHEAETRGIYADESDNAGILRYRTLADLRDDLTAAETVLRVLCLDPVLAMTTHKDTSRPIYDAYAAVIALRVQAGQ